jgi:hypothetical protein
MDSQELRVYLHNGNSNLCDFGCFKILTIQNNILTTNLDDLIIVNIMPCCDKIMTNVKVKVLRLYQHFDKIHMKEHVKLIKKYRAFDNKTKRIIISEILGKKICNDAVKLIMSYYVNSSLFFDKSIYSFNKTIYGVVG